MEPRTYKFNKSTLTVKFGNIIDSQAEVIVSSDDCYVTMGGGVSRAILNAGGKAIIKDAQKMAHVPLGDVIATTAGKLEHQKFDVRIEQVKTFEANALHIHEPLLHRL